MMACKSAAEKAVIAEQRKASKRRLTQYRQANGLCTQCGKPVLPGKRLCIDHHVKVRRKKDPRWNNDIPRSMRPGFGVCYICGADAVSGKSLCKDCFTALSTSAKERMQNPTPEQRAAQKEYMRVHKALNELAFLSRKRRS
ncbi:hypothetical protein [Desulfitobacterium hafniense]|uniref:hypothetical protein n=1 Tax=Desulfitobacterium hafniense TaxID=49338 RepID=UPI0011D0A840|nr:hypothetical protein [Desulfitobacterium hafniense]